MRHRLLQLILLFAVAEPAPARTWYVTPDGTGQAPTIQAAVDSCVDGDEVLLAPGSYTYATQGASETSMVNIRKSITLRGEAGAESTILDAQSQPARPIRCHPGAVVLIDGLTLQGGNPPFEGGSGSGGISLSSGSTIQNCVVRNNRADMIGAGGGIRAYRATILNCLVEGNRAGREADGGGIHSTEGRIIGCTIRGNVVGSAHGGSGGGIASRDTEILDCLIEGNRSTTLNGAHGGGISADGGSIRRCLFVDNEASDVGSSGWGGGVYANGSEPVVISECVFIGNRAGAEGRGNGGAAVGGSGINTLVDRCTIIGNSSGVGHCTITNSIIALCDEGPACSGNVAISCSMLFGNALGDAICGTDGGGNSIVDPQFCAVAPTSSRNVSLQSDSPCANAPGCGQVGAAPVGCETVAVEAVPWSHVKSIFR